MFSFSLCALHFLFLWEDVWKENEKSQSRLFLHPPIQGVQILPSALSLRNGIFKNILVLAGGRGCVEALLHLSRVC